MNKSRENLKGSINIDKYLMLSSESDAVNVQLNGEHTYFLEKKDDDTCGEEPLSIDIDLSDKKLNNIEYDPILRELQQSDKVLQDCEKDSDDTFVLPEFQLDQLDSLTFSPDVTMLANEILPSSSVRHISISDYCTDLITSNRLTISLNGNEAHVMEIPDSQRLCNNRQGTDAQYSTTVAATVTNNAMKNDNSFCKDYHSSKESSSSALDFDIFLSEYHLPTVKVDNQKTLATLQNDGHLDEQKDESPVKKKRQGKVSESRLSPYNENEKKLNVVNNKLESSVNKNELHDNETDQKKKKDKNKKASGIMAVVAISTNKISNTTQIVINTGNKEQIYQGKTSELIQVTGNLPKLVKMEPTTVWNGNIKGTGNTSDNNRHEVVISNALEELGITDQVLQPNSITEHGKIWLCPRDDCARRFTRLYALKGHLLAHYGVKPFKCDFDGCAWAFYSEFKLKRHKETHLKRKDFVCKIPSCKRRFTTIYNLWSHEKLHSRPNRVVCQVPGCQEKFQTKRALELHMKSHDQSHAPYVCKHEGCDKRYYSSNALTSHQRCHSYKESDIKCSWPGCNKVFDKPCRLKAHIRSHTGCKPYLCTYQDCQWAFASSSKLKRHQKKHTNERKFVCEVASCGKAFMRSEHLKEHRLTHNEGRYFHCNLCDAKFSAKSSLYVHIKKHRKANASNDSVSLSGNCMKQNSAVKGSLIEEQKVPQNQNDNNYDYTDYVLSSASYSTSQSMGETITPCDTIMSSATNSSAFTSESDEASVDALHLSDLESTRATTSLLKPSLSLLSSSLSTSSKSSISSDTIYFKKTSPSKDQGCARTGLTRNDVWRLKVNNNVTIDQPADPIVGPTDVILGSSNIGESLFLTEDLPSVYYQDDIGGTECQVLLLDSVATENIINLRDLE